MKSWLILFLILFGIFFVSAGVYGVGDYGTGEYNVGEVATNETEEEGGGSSSTGCTYDWDCTNWFPTECPIEGYQERICVNRGTCTGTVGMPALNKTCVYEHKEPLFDIFVKIPDRYKKICPSEKVKADIELQNYGKEELLDAFMTYWIIDGNNTLVAELKDTRSVIQTLDFDISMSIPENSAEGTYRLYAQINYGENKTALAGESFEVTEECGFRFGNYIPEIIFGFIIAIISISILIVLISIRRTLKYAKKNRQINHN